MAHKFHGDGWGALAPGQRQWTPPLEITAPDPQAIHAPEKAIPLWAELTYPDGHRMTAKAFAKAWSGSAVRIQWVEHSLARYAWVAPDQVRRRQLVTR